MISTPEGCILPGCIELTANWVDLATDAEIVALVRRRAAISRHPYLIQTHCGEGPSFDSIESFVHAALTNTWWR